MGKRAYINDGNDNWIPLVSSLPNMAPYATIEYVDNSINAIDLNPYATEVYVDSAIDSAKVSASAAAVSYLVDSAPNTLDTLNELAQALGEDANFSTTVTNSLSNKLDISTASSTYITQSSASTTYLSQSSASTTYATKSSPTITNATLSGTTGIEETFESITVSATAATGTINYDFLTNHGVTYYTTNSSGNWTLNVRGNGSTSLNSILPIGKALTIVFMVTNGSTAYYQTAFQIDGASVTPKWQGGTAPSSGNTNSIDIYSFTIIKTASATYTVIGSQVRFA